MSVYTTPEQSVEAARRTLTCTPSQPCGSCDLCMGLPDESVTLDEPSMLDRLRAALVDTAGLDDIPEPQPLIRGILQRDSLAFLIGPPGHAKSLIALDMAGSVATGLTWQGHPVTAGPVLYLVAEGVSGVRPRVRAWEDAAARKMEGAHFLPVAVQAGNEPDWAALVELAAELRPQLVVLDTLARIAVGLDENAAKDMGVFVHRAEQLRIATRANVLVVHHQGRNGDHMRGSTALEGAATTIVRVAKSDELVTLSCAKQKDAEPFDDFRLRVVPRLTSVTLTMTDAVVSTAASSRKWLADWWATHAGEAVSVSVLVKSGVVTEPTFHRNKLALIDAGVVRREGKGNTTRYRLTADPTLGDSRTLTLKSVRVSESAGETVTGSRETLTTVRESEVDQPDPVTEPKPTFHRSIGAARAAGPYQPRGDGIEVETWSGLVADPLFPGRRRRRVVLQRHPEVWPVEDCSRRPNTCAGVVQGHCAELHSAGKPLIAPVWRVGRGTWCDADLPVQYRELLAKPPAVERYVHSHDRPSYRTDGDGWEQVPPCICGDAGYPRRTS